MWKRGERIERGEGGKRKGENGEKERGEEKSMTKEHRREQVISLHTYIQTAFLVFFLLFISLLLLFFCDRARHVLFALIVGRAPVLTEFVVLSVVISLVIRMLLRVIVSSSFFIFFFFLPLLSLFSLYLSSFSPCLFSSLFFNKKIRCIERWLKSQKKCPSCNAKAKKTDVRLLYVAKISVVDNHQQQLTLQQLKAEQKERYTDRYNTVHMCVGERRMKREKERG